MLAIGPSNFMEMLKGAHAMDQHFRTAKPLNNLPMLMGLAGCLASQCLRPAVPRRHPL